ncbi:hypothetical protein [uncultured Desulfuromusa sp.]|uniref:TipJ family phage tail tip protein n=1 Tax=uncultured Desulfuromusa sp. TaxID=219183 RepID=UPI002AA7AB72|nr:hypothetical protein [uncultured Desulfuromusa sp.]
MQSDLVPVIACPNPFRSGAIVTSVAGKTLAEILLDVQPDPILARYAHIYVDDRYIDERYWDTLIPAPGQSVTIRIIPQGGDDKNPLATILAVVVMIVATVYGGPLGGAIGRGLGFAGTGSGWGAVGSAVIGIAGSLAINAIVPPPKQNVLSSVGSDKPTLSIAGARNTAALYQPIPAILGEHLVTPYYGAPPYTELVGQDQYLRLLFVVGYGPLDISKHKIGETDLFDYDDVEIEVKHGYADDGAVSLYPGSVVETTVGVTLNESTGWVEQTSAAGIDELNVEITFASGLVQFDSHGEKQERTVSFEVEYSPTGLNTWTSAIPTIVTSDHLYDVPNGPGLEVVSYDGGDSGSQPVYAPVTRTNYIYVSKTTGRLGDGFSVPSSSYPICSFTQTGYSKTISNFTDVRPDELKETSVDNYVATLLNSDTISIAAGSFTSSSELSSATGKAASAVRFGVVIPVANGQYDIRVRRVTADPLETQTIYDTATWSTLRSIENSDPIAVSGVAKVALRIKATDQLQNIIDQYNCVAKSICPAWTGTEWVEQPTSQPAALYRHVFQGSPMKSPLADSRLDLTELQEWAEETDLYGYFYNAVQTARTSPFEMVRNIAAIGRASYANKDGLHSVVRDTAVIEERGVKQWLTPRNSWDVDGSKSFDEIHGVYVNYIDASAGYRQEQIFVPNDGYTEATATRIDKIETLGITEHSQAYKQGRYYLAVAQLRPEMHSRMVDVEHLVCTRGDLIRVTDDVAMHGLYSGRVKEVFYHATTGDAIAVTLDETVTMETGKTYALRFRLSSGGDIYRAVTLDVGETNTLVFETSIAIADAPEIEDLAMFGESDQETSLKIIHHIEKSEDLTARIYYVDAAPEVWAADLSTIPDYDPGISVPVDSAITIPDIPSITSISTESATLTADGSMSYSILVSLSPIGGRVPAHKYEVRYQSIGSNDGWSIVVGNPAIITGLTPSLAYSVQCRALSKDGFASAWSDEESFSVGVQSNQSTDWSDITDDGGTKPVDNADATATALQSLIELTSGGIRSTLENGDYAEIGSNGVRFSIGGVLVDSVSRMEDGIASSGVYQDFEYDFTTDDIRVFLFLDDNTLYASALQSDDQKLVLKAEMITREGFMPTGELQFSGATAIELTKNTALAVGDTYYDSTTDRSVDDVIKMICRLSGAGNVGVYYSSWTGSAWGSETLLGTKTSDPGYINPAAFSGSGSDDWRSATLAIKPADGSDITIVDSTSDYDGDGSASYTLPSSAEDDVIFVFLTKDRQDAHNVPAGWTTVLNSTSQNMCAVCVYQRVGATSPTTYSFVDDGGLPDQNSTFIAVTLRGVHADTLDAISVFAAGSSGMPNSPEITAQTEGALIIAAGFLDDDNVTNTAAPTGFANLINQPYTPGSTNNSTTMVAFKWLTEMYQEFVTPTLTSGRHRFRFNAVATATLRDIELQTSGGTAAIPGDMKYLAFQGGQ